MRRRQRWLVAIGIFAILILIDLIPPPSRANPDTTKHRDGEHQRTWGFATAFGTGQAAGVRLVGSLGPQTPVGAATDGSHQQHAGFIGVLHQQVITVVDDTIDLPASYLLRPCAPNPFNPATVIRFETPQSGRVVLEIHDLRGRLVCRLCDQVLPAGRHEARWDGRDDQGRGMSSGTYFCRMRATGHRSVIKMLLLK